MALLTVRPTKFDEEVARQVARHTNRSIEGVAGVVTWGADEHVIVAAAVLGWLLTRRASEPARRMSTHVLACAVVTAALPHLFKAVIDQQRPDRCEIHGRRHGVPFSGKPNDAFPSGHALHVGALASAATLLPAKVRNAAWAAGGLLVATRIVLLAHWVTDVLAGLALGIASERVIRGMTRPLPLKGCPAGTKRMTPPDRA
jgi:membrane-associated phospholipid phosphatase